jgi:hypothetical protein
VAENHPPGRQLLRCRLRPRWSLQAKVAFWALAGLELLALSTMGRWSYWFYLLLLTLPLCVFLLRRDQRNLQSLLIVLLNEIAEDWKLTKTVLASPATAPGAPSPAAAGRRDTMFQAAKS